MKLMDGKFDISVVIPTYNRGNLITRAIESVLDQTRRPHEVIVVDDGSADDTRRRVAPYRDAVRYIYQKNAGASIARNRGVQEARSEWVAFLDSDDIWYDRHLERIAEVIAETYGVADLYFSDMEQSPADGAGSLWDSHGFKINGEYELIKDATEWVMRERQPMMLQTSVFRRSSYLASGGLWDRLRTRHDTHLFLKLGIGRPACAVAGYGARQTSDDNPNNRLMSAFGGNTRGFWLETIPLYEDLMSSGLPLASGYRRLLRARLAHAHWRVSRFDWKERNIGSSLWEAGKCFIVEPVTLVLIFLNALGVSLGLKSR